MPSSLKISFPPAFTNALNSLKILDFDFVKFTPVECVKQVNFVESLYITTLAPIFGFGIVVLCYLIHVSIINHCSCMLKICEERKKNYWETVSVDCYEPVRANGEIVYKDGKMKLKRNQSGEKVEGIAQDDRFRRSFVINPLWPTYMYGLLYITSIILPGITSKIFQMFVCYDLGTLLSNFTVLTHDELISNHYILTVLQMTFFVSYPSLH